jgi:peptidoglycan hydrolase-like protein with peptidoglycan-binding domain
MSSISGPSGPNGTTGPDAIDDNPYDDASTDTTTATGALASNPALADVVSGNEFITHGSRGDAARAVQQALIDLGFLPAGGADGAFGRKSVAALQAFQRAQHLSADGICGGATLNALDKALAASGGSTGTTGTTGGTGRPQPPAGPMPQEEVGGDENASTLDQNTLTMKGDGQWSSSIGRPIYEAGYLPRTSGPLFNPLGTAMPADGVVSAGDKTLDTSKSPVERFDEAMKRGTGSAGGLTARYKVEGKQAEAKDWWGYCDRWSFSALDPNIGPKVNQPIMYNGVYFSTAELRGLASFLGRSDEGAGEVFDTKVSPVDLQKAMTMYMKDGGSGFVGNVWLDSAHNGEHQIWNQPFDAVDQNVKELKGDELAKVMKDQFGLSGDAAAGKRIFYVETTGHYGEEAGDDYEGGPNESTKNWKSWILTDASGKAQDGKWAPGSDDALGYIWRPQHTGTYSPEMKFFRDMLSNGVSEDKVQAFDAAIGALPQGPVSDAQKAALKAQFAGLAGAYTADELNAKLKPFGMSAADFK